VTKVLPAGSPAGPGRVRPTVRKVPSRGGGDPGKLAATLAIALTVAACQTTAEPRIEVREVRVPVAVKCATDPGPRPEYPDTDAALAAVRDVFEAAKLVMAGRALRIGREAELEASVAGCR
jgi:hypothetical protein